MIDDEEGMRHFITKVLEPHCKRVMQAASAKEAGALMDNHYFDLLMIDNLMPEQTGLDWLAEQRKLGLFSDAIMMTAYADVETAVMALRTGVADFFGQTVSRQPSRKCDSKRIGQKIPAPRQRFAALCVGV